MARDLFDEAGVAPDAPPPDPGQPAPATNGPRDLFAEAGVSPEQMTGTMRKPAIFGSGMAKGLSDFVGSALGGAAAAGASEANADNPQQYVAPVATSVASAADTAGLTNRPDLIPQDQTEKTVAAAGQGAGAALPFSLVGGVPGAAWGLLTGATGGATGEVAANAFPNHPELARAGGNLAGGLGIFGALKSLKYLSTPAIEAVERQFLPGAVDRQAADAVTKTMASDGSAPTDLASRLAAAQDRGTPLTIADIAGEDTQGLYGKVYRTPGPARQDIRTFQDERDAGAGERITGGVDNALGGGWTDPAEIMAARKAAAGPAYDAFEAGAPLNPDTVAAGGELDKMMSRPSMNKAALNALSLAKEEGRDPASLGLTFNEAGDPKFEKVPSWQTLDYLKRGLDDVVEKYRDPVTKTLNLDTAGRATNSTRATFLNFMDRENPAYADARAAWGGPTQSLAALNDGAASLNLTPTQAANQLAKLSPGDAALYRQGASGAYAAQIGNTSLGGNEALSVMGNATKQQRLLALAKSNDSYNDAMKQLADEKAMFDTKTRTMGGPATAGRLAEDNAGKSAPNVSLPLAAGAAAKGNFLEAGSTLLSPYLRQIFGHSASMSPKVNSAIVQLLHSQDPEVFSGLVARMNPQPGLPGPRVAVPAGLLGSLSTRSSQ